MGFEPRVGSQLTRADIELQLHRRAITIACDRAGRVGRSVDRASSLRAREVYEVDHLDFAEAMIVAQAEATGIGSALSFDKSLDRVGRVERQGP